MSIIVKNKCATIFCMCVQITMHNDQEVIFKKKNVCNCQNIIHRNCDIRQSQPNLVWYFKRFENFIVILNINSYESNDPSGLVFTWICVLNGIATQNTVEATVWQQFPVNNNWHSSTYLYIFGWILFAHKFALVTSKKCFFFYIEFNSMSCV